MRHNLLNKSDSFYSHSSVVFFLEELKSLPSRSDHAYRKLKI